MAPPLTNHYGLVGMAFDYLLRFYIKRLNPDAVEHPWVSEVSLQLLERLQLLSMFTKDEIFSDDVDTIINPELLDPYVYDKVEEIIEYSKKVYNEFIKTGKMNSDLYRAALLLAQVDLIYRAGVVDKNLGSVDKNDIKDLKNLISIVKPEYFKAKKICVLNPTFGKHLNWLGSRL